ncbi:MAG: lysophospholipid transporter LplT [Burkholderiales bacterium]|jgi:MFS family permease|nr:lysophospholipid transporter LplT [Burkholderiales bacterium]
MKHGFYTIIAAQFFSSLADNALLIAAIALLTETMPDDASWMTPLLRGTFILSYVLFAAFVGAFADAMPKGRVMLITNTIKFGGCLLLIFGMHPLAAYAVVGLGAAAYSPAKYGILTELLPPKQLVAANSWIEGATVASIIFGASIGGALVSDSIGQFLISITPPFIHSVADAAMFIIMFGYVIAAVFNVFIPNTGVDHRIPSKNPLFLVREFSHCVLLLWRDRLGQISLATTTLFWGAGATLQFVVLDWAAGALGYSLSKATYLQAVVAGGVAVGAVLAAKLVSLRNSVKILPLGAVMGIVVIAMIFVHHLRIAVPLLVLLGVMSGFFVVPMNALLQHRGHVLMGAGHSIAVQNFNENIGVLVMVSLYAAMMHADISVNVAITIFGCFLFVITGLIIIKHARNQARGDSLHLIGMEKPKERPSLSPPRQKP